MHGEGDLSVTDLALYSPQSFSHYRLKVNLDSVLDIRNDETLKPFCEVISQIDPSLEFYERATRLGVAPPRTLETLDQLRAALLEEKFSQWATWVDQPSPSQWFGHYVRNAGVQGIIYPSVRNPNGFNVAVFPDALGDSEGRIELLDKTDSVEASQRYLDKTNYRFHMVESGCSEIRFQ